MNSIIAEWIAHAPPAPPMPNENRWHIFLSYRSVYRSWVIQLYDVLKDLGYEVFLDQYVLQAGQPLVRGLDEGLEKSAKGILVWSAESDDSEWCKSEYETMEGKANTDPNFKYVIVLVDDIKPPPLARRRILVDFKDSREGPRGAGLLRLLHGLNGDPLPDAAIRLATQVDGDTHSYLNEIESARINGFPDQIIELSKSTDLAWAVSQLLPCKAAEALIKLRKYPEALDLLKIIREKYPKSIRPPQLEGLALARSGQWKLAQALLGKLVVQGEQDPETLGIYARTWMDRYKESGRRLHLETSRQYYAMAFAGDPKDYYTGINAAAKSVFLGELSEADRFAALVERIVGDKVVPGDYWKTATIAEVQLIRKNYEKAAELYKQAILIAPEDIGSHESTWGQAKLLMEKLETSQETFKVISTVFEHINNGD